MINIHEFCIMESDELVKKAKLVEQQTQKLFQQLKKTKPKDLDDTLQDLHDEEFETRDCLKCANCCKTTSPIFYDRDVERASKRLRMKPSQFIEKYLRVDEDKDYVVKSSPCPFLDYENYCTIYEDRPTACREYPHTNRKRFYQILDLTLKNTSVCPAVFNIVEKLKVKIANRH